MSHETTLRECPFCGGETWEPLSRRWKNAVGDISYSAYVHCPECEFSIETKSCGYETAEEAIEAATEAWNTRATPGIGKLTAEQVREAVKRHATFDYGELGEYVSRKSWQAIADELNATLGSGTCEPIIDPWACDPSKYDAYCGNCRYPIGDGELKPWKYCPDCGFRIGRR